MKLSIVVPIGHKDQNFKLFDQLKDKFQGHEIIVSCSSQNIEAKKLVEHVDQFLTIQNSTKAKALNTGAEAASNSLLWFIHLDSDLSLIEISDMASSILNDKFLVMSLVKGNEYFNIRYQIKPFMIWIWISILLLSLGGLMSLFKKKNEK